MKHPRRKAAWLAAFLLAASLTALPREGAAWPPYVEGGPPGSNEGDPDVPGTAARPVAYERHAYSLGGRLLVVRVGQIAVVMIIPNSLLRNSQPANRGTHR